MSRFIDLTPTWKEAAAIIAAALENGTGEGREAARAELFRMAAILDDLKAAQDAAEKTGTALFEVITSATTGQPFGQTFAHKENADAYAAAMQQAGYSAEVSPEFGTQPSFRAAMQEAADFYGHPELMDACKLTAEQEQQP